MKISWNTGYVKGMRRSKFVRKFGKVYPGVDLGAEYDRIVPPKRKKSGDGKEQAEKQE